MFSEGPIAFPDPLDRPGRTMLTSEGTLNRSSHIINNKATGQLRILTPIECERSAPSSSVLSGRLSG